MRANSDGLEVETRTGTKDRESVIRRGTDELPGGAGVEGLLSSKSSRKQLPELLVNCTCDRYLTRMRTV